ncbi:hypothetical protein ARTHROSP310_35510 [Arthrobacter sp. AD-310]
MRVPCRELEGRLTPDAEKPGDLPAIVKAKVRCATPAIKKGSRTAECLPRINGSAIPARRSEIGSGATHLFG